MNPTSFSINDGGILALRRAMNILRQKRMTREDRGSGPMPLEAILLFKRKLPKKVPDDFRAKMIGEACNKAIAEFERMMTLPIHRMEVTYGWEENVRSPTYCWARCQTIVLSAHGYVPKRLRRKDTGLLRPIWI